jgi:hypothetical protein
MSDLYPWALTADGQVVQLFHTQKEALTYWRRYSKRRGNITEFAVQKVKELFDAQ